MHRRNTAYKYEWLPCIGIAIDCMESVEYLYSGVPAAHIYLADSMRIYWYLYAWYMICIWGRY